MKMYTQYSSNNTYTVNIALMYQVDSEHEVPSIISWVDLNGELHTVSLQDEFTLANSDPSEEVPDEEPTRDEIVNERIEEKKDANQKVKDEIWGKYNACLEQFKQEQPVRFEAWHRTAALTDFEVPDSSAANFNANYDAETLKAEKAWQVCETLKKYPWIGMYEANKELDESDGTKSLSDFNDPKTPAPFDQSDLDKEAEKAEKFKCSNLGRQMGLCAGDFTGINRGDQFGAIDRANQNHGMIAMNTYLTTNPDLAPEVALYAATHTMCEGAWLYTANAQLSIERWPDALTDGTCDEHIPELVNIKATLYALDN